jgi:hypothetical protein
LVKYPYIGGSLQIIYLCRISLVTNNYPNCVFKITICE